MDIQEFFYWVGSIALILVSLLTIALFAVVFCIKKLADKTAQRFIDYADDMTRQITRASHTWRNLTLTRFVIRALRYIF